MKKIPVVLLPGLLEDADGFAYPVEALADVADFVVADLTRSNTIADLARDALSQAPAGEFALAGHSMGGYVALEILRRAPARVSKLALLNTHARPDTPEATENRRRLVALAGKDFEAVVTTLMGRVLSPKHLADPTITATVEQMAQGVGREAFARQQAAIIGRMDSRPYLGNIRCPTLVLAAREDAIMPVELLEEMAQAIPGAKLVVIEDSGHTSLLEQPEAVTDALYEWLTGEPRGIPNVVAGTRRPPPT